MHLSRARQPRDVLIARKSGTDIYERKGESKRRRRLILTHGKGFCRINSMSGEVRAHEESEILILRSSQTSLINHDLQALVTLSLSILLGTGFW